MSFKRTVKAALNRARFKASLIGSQKKDISVIIAVYNGVQFVGRAIDSVLKQNYPLTRIELIVVDDCSNDGTWEVLKEYQQKYPHVIRLLRTDSNSGNAGIPRNLGLDTACGEYVLFLDADDWLGEQAIYRALLHLHEWKSDLLVVKIIGEGSRVSPTANLHKTERVVDVRTSPIWQSLGPQKIIKRSVIEENSLRFPWYLPEDIPFSIRAYCYSRIVSVAVDYDYYHITYTDENVSYREWADLDQNLKSLGDTLAFIEQVIPPADRSQHLLPRLFRRDVYQMLKSLCRYPRDSQEAYLRKMRKVFAPFYQYDVYANCDIERRLLLDLGMLATEETALAFLELGGLGNLHKEAAYTIVDGKIVATLSDRKACYTCDVTYALRRRFAISSFKATGEMLRFAGELYCSYEFAMATDMPDVKLIVRLRGNERELGCPCKIAKTEYVLGENSYAFAYAWEATVSLTAIAKAAADCNNDGDKLEWYFLMRLSAPGLGPIDTRLGDKATDEVRTAFANWPGTSRPAPFRPFVTSYGNFSIMQDSSGKPK